MDAAEGAGLRYVSDDRPGYTRKAKGDDFDWLDADGKLIRDEQRLLRIKRLAIPPAWTEVWVSPSPNGHIQATVGTRAVGSNTFTTSAGGRLVTKTNTIA